MADQHGGQKVNGRSRPADWGDGIARDDARRDEGPGHGTAGVWPRTAAFLGAGAALLALGIGVQPQFRAREVKPETERVLFPELTDVQKAAALEIVKYDEGLATLQPFKVVQAGGVWVLPSHQNYPADARDHLAAAATELIDLESLDVVSTSAADHETYGVIEPDPDKIKPGMTGVGELVEIRDAGGAKVARLVVGKEDKRPSSAATGGKKLRFVRRAGQDPVYRVEIDTSKFTTKFDDWIEKDLLKISPWDVRRLVLDDYSLGAVESGGRLQVVQDRKDKIEVAYDDKGAKWSLVRLDAYGGGAEPKPESLAENEELAAQPLNDLRNALGDLKIVDVVRKPAGLSADLKAEEKFTADEEAVRSMRQRGFLPLKSGEILSTDGETIVGMKDGVEYVLRFGAGTSVGAGARPEGEDEEEEVADATGRYLLVMARFNESLLPQPQLDPLPDAPEETPKAPEAGAEGAAGEGGAADLLKAADEAEAKAQAALEERRRVERENRRRQDEYDDRVKGAQRRVRELNARFADWYYIVPAKEYAKIHLDRAAVVGPKSADAAAVDARRAWREAGFTLAACDRRLALARDLLRHAHLAGADPAAAALLRESILERMTAAGQMARLRALSPEQFAFSVLTASGSIESFRTSAEAKVEKEPPEALKIAPPAALAVVRALVVEMQTVHQAAGLLSTVAGLFGDPLASEFQSSANQALWLGNSAEVAGWLRPGGANLASRLAALPDDGLLAFEAYLALFSRYPDVEEKAVVAAALAAKADDRPTAIAELLGAMLSSNEFRFNH